MEEIIWVKTNQLQRIIRTGRTGHWLNHSKEHCLVGIKGDPIVNRNIDTDVIVAEVRETSRKPDEVKIVHVLHSRYTCKMLMQLIKSLLHIVLICNTKTEIGDRTVTYRKIQICWSLSIYEVKQ